jgi:hypothetical protein
MLVGSAALILAAAGCGDPVAKVSGKVTYKDKSLPGGTVVFVTDDNKRLERVEIQSDGTYSSDKVPVGSLRVGVEPPPKSLKGMSMIPKGSKMPTDMPESLKKVYEEGSNYVDIPAKFRDPATSGISVTVERAGRTFDIPLSDSK